MVGTADSPGALARLLDRTQVEAVLADARPFLTALLAADRLDAATAENGEAEPSLTPREIGVLAAMADGASNKVIARRLGISLHTAKVHVASSLAHPHAHCRTEAGAHPAP